MMEGNPKYFVPPQQATQYHAAFRRVGPHGGRTGPRHIMHYPGWTTWADIRYTLPRLCPGCALESITRMAD